MPNMREINICSYAVEKITEPNPNKKLELCGRVCYKTEDMITETSYADMIKKLVNNGHWSVLEHSKIIVRGSRHNQIAEIVNENRFMDFGNSDNDDDDEELLKIKQNTYLDISPDLTEVKGNIRAFMTIFKNYGDDLKVEAQIFKKRFPHIFFNVESHDDAKPSIEIHDADCHTFRITCDRAVANEFVRHRMFSFSQESTRFCNYGKKPMSFILPEPFPWASDKNSSKYIKWHNSMQYAQDVYLSMIEDGCKPQEARSVLPCSLKTELIMSGELYQWKDFLRLRTASGVHPQALVIALEIKRQLGV